MMMGRSIEQVGMCMLAYSELMVRVHVLYFVLVSDGSGHVSAWKIFN